MNRKLKSNNKPPIPKKNKAAMRLEYRTPSQKLAWESFNRHPVMFLSGPAGVGKTYLAMSFAISQLYENKIKKIVLTRPIKEAGESLGFLPGTFQEKVDPYMKPLFDSLEKFTGNDLNLKQDLASKIEIAPLAYLRGRTFDDSICIFDEAQNATAIQLKLFLTRMGENSKMIIDGDPTQSDIKDSGFIDCMDKLEDCPGVGIIDFPPSSIVRNQYLQAILERL